MKRNGADPDQGFFPTIASPISPGEPLACTGISRMNRSRIDQHRVLLAACALTCLVTMRPCASIAGREIGVHRPVPEQSGTTLDEPAGKAGPTTQGQLLSEIRIRDPFMLSDRNTQTYYLVASSGDAITVRESKDLVTWSDPRVVFTKPAGFWGSGSIWAPEMHAYRGKFYLFATFMNDTSIGEQWQDWPPRVERGTQVMHADSPLGPFQPFGNTPHTPVTDMALDGTMWIEEDVPYMVLFRKDGGHAMIFRAFDGALVVSLHSPNRSPDERCQLFEVEDTGDTLRIVRTR